MPCWHRPDRRTAFQPGAGFRDGPGTAAQLQRRTSRSSAMPNTADTPNLKRRGLCFAGLGAGVALAATASAVNGTAEAAECPSDQRIAGATLTGATAPRGVTDQVLTTVDLAPEKVRFP